ncbi:hypothetical protein SAMN04488107_0067 [Geodermatophilus saharensis]|uniref:ATP-binding protein n=1 Tax=Geodermatophilus saharensis TaxID=1137994 RepID=A0A238ZIA3_9ACTN|nr:hypothetical protein [Geodermatophilus saharensis]SNR82443.1 hypothetical protein SAMN04488107_0067 [Geodermatophilus saharensis]
MNQDHAFAEIGDGSPDVTPSAAEKKSVATMLVEIGEELYEFGFSDAGETFGVPRTGPKVIRMLRGGKTSLRRQLAREYFIRTGKAAPQQALTDALLVIEGKAQDGDEQPMALRVAGHDGALWLDLGDATGRAVRITGDGWQVCEQAPMLFRRTALNAELPEPVAGGDLAELWNLLNVAEEDQPLLLAALVAVLVPDIPHPVLGLFGEQGTGKSTAARVLTMLLDPSPVPLRKPPRDADSWVTAAAGSWVVGMDNLSEIPDWLSDSMCRAVTGDGDVRRRLYTDGDLAVFAFRRCLIINGIDLGAVRGDLTERLLPIHLRTIDARQRREEHELWPAWQQTHPRLLGALLDLAAGVLAARPSVRLDSKPRMADFARILAAVDSVLGTSGLQSYLAKQGQTAVDTLTGDRFITAIAAIFSASTFHGTAAELLAQVPWTAESRPPKGWPTAARQVTTVLRKQAPTMRKAGWRIDDDRGANHDKVIRWTITPPGPEMTGKADPQRPQPPHPDAEQYEHDQARAGLAGHAGTADDDRDLTPAPDPHPAGGISAGLLAAAGLAGVAGIGSGRSQGAEKRTAPCGHPVEAITSDTGRCGICISERLAARRTAVCRTCQQPIYPAAGDVHPGCEMEQSA